MSRTLHALAVSVLLYMNCAPGVERSESVSPHFEDNCEEIFAWAENAIADAPVIQDGWMRGTRVDVSTTIRNDPRAPQLAMCMCRDFRDESPNTYSMRRTLREYRRDVAAGSGEQEAARRNFEELYKFGVYAAADACGITQEEASRLTGSILMTYFTLQELNMLMSTLHLRIIEIH